MSDLLFIFVGVGIYFCLIGSIYVGSEEAHTKKHDTVPNVVEKEESEGIRKRRLIIDPVCTTEPLVETLEKIKSALEKEVPLWDSTFAKEGEVPSGVISTKVDIDDADNDIYEMV